jgi:hypothetical protein
MHDKQLTLRERIGLIALGFAIVTGLIALVTGKQGPVVAFSISALFALWFIFGGRRGQE